MSLAATAIRRRWHTMRHLRPIQFYGFARNQVLRSLRLRAAAVKGVRLSKSLRPPVCSFLQAGTSVSGTRVAFLNHSVEYPAGICWSDPGQTKLWRYHLHSMGFLRQPGVTAEQRRQWMHAWVCDNADPHGEGWEPYPTSLRLVNWFKVWWEGGSFHADRSLFDSAFTQARHLRRFVEYHLQANHLFENLKALFWAGCIFQGSEAERWRMWAAQLMMDQLEEQILQDGGHYERSPMYHALVLEGCLDLLNIQSAWATQHPQLADLLERKAKSMLAWLEAVSHPDGEIALLNDAAFKVAPPPPRLLDYGLNLGLTWPSPGRLEHLESSGYVVIRDGGHFLIIDIGPMGPDHQPAHGHCDLFSFEWSYGGDRIICDSGVYAYQDPVMRPYARSTEAHNTVRVDCEDQSEIWKEFRVARRARVFAVSVEAMRNGGVSVGASHDGYRRLAGHPIHRREFTYHDGTLVLQDSVTGRHVHRVEAFIHFHPTVAIGMVHQGSCDLMLAKNRIGRIIFDHWQEAHVSQGWYCPEFGRRESNSVLALASGGNLPFHGRIEITLNQRLQ